MTALRRVSVTVPRPRAEEARAAMLELFPDGFEEVERDSAVELAAYTNAGGEERILQTFGAAAGVDVADGWHERWRQFHRPVRIGDVWIGPSWETPPKDAQTLILDPGLAFGTGGHPTTRLSLELVLERDRGSLLDVGSGSGVLAVAAGLSGFSPVLAVDSDAVAVEMTRRTAAANGVELRAWVADGASDDLPPVDVAVANISAGDLEAIVPRLVAGSVVTSGYLLPDEPRYAGYDWCERRASEGWAADLHTRAH